MLKLVISDDEGKKTVVPLVRDEITIGRKEGNTIRLTERNVSRRHARIVKRASDYVLEDLASYNGIVVNNTRLVEARPIRHGDEIRIGDYILSILDEPGVQPTPPPPPSPPSEPIVPLLSAPPPATPAAAPSTVLKAPEGPPVPEHIRGLRLVFLAPAGVPPPVMLDRLPIVLGRSEAAEVALPFSSISREHARIFVEGNHLMIEDMGSANGVQVNGEKVKKARLGPGDMVQLGVVEFRVARRGDSTVVIQQAALEEKQRAQRTPLGLVAAIVGGGLALGLAVVIAFNRMNAGAPRTEAPSLSQSNAPVVSPPVAPTVVPTPPEAPTPSTPPAGSAESPSGPQAPTPTLLAAAPETPPTSPPAIESSSLPASPEAQIPVRQQLESPRERRAREAREAREREASRLAHSTAPSRPTAPPAPSRSTTPAASASSPAATPAPGGDNSLSPMERVAQCRSAGGDEHARNTCIINALRGRASSDQELRVLAMTYQVEGRRLEAIRTMQTYIQRYPQGSMVSVFNQYILRNQSN
jgi:pSer/pThr/pTyr-binding forkhead associated (FHA) protein